MASAVEEPSNGTKTRWKRGAFMTGLRGRRFREFESSPGSLAKGRAICRTAPLARESRDGESGEGTWLSPPREAPPVPPEGTWHRRPGTRKRTTGEGAQGRVASSLRRPPADLGHSAPRSRSVLKGPSTWSDAIQVPGFQS